MSLRADPRCSCAAGWEPAVVQSTPKHLVGGCAGIRVVCLSVPGSPQGFLPGQVFFLWEQIVDTQVPQGRGVPGGLLSACADTYSAASSVRSGAADEVFFQGGFALFPGRKKCEDRSALGVGTECGLYFMDAGGSWRAHGARASAGGGG